MDEAVINILEQAGNQDPNIFKPAEQILQEWENQRGFYTSLYNIFSNQSLPINVRWIAVLYFKNGIDRYWRKHAPGEISADEKEFLRQGLTNKFDEPVKQLAIQIAVLTAKIARYDCPKEWNSLIPTLLETIRSSNSLIQHRALLTFHHVVKALASKRLSADKKLFQELTSNVFDFILNLWNIYTESFINFALRNDANSNQIQDSVERALLCLRILRKLILNGIVKPSDNENVMEFLKVIFARAKTCLECRKRISLRYIHIEECDKFIIHLTKVLLGVLEKHPFCYIHLISITLEFTVFYCFTEAGQSIAFERFIIQCLNLLKKILQTNDYKPNKVEENKYHFALMAYKQKQDFFTPEILREICIRLVTNYFILSSSDLESWDTDPENFGVDDCGESWKYNLRPCTESVFLTILHQFKDILSNVLVELIQKHHHPVDPHDLQSILVKDAVYNAVGLAGFDLYDEVNFDQWFSTTLKQELQEKSSNYRIIRRRICWLIGRWTGVKLSVEFRPELYNLMIEALNPIEDLGVRLAASDALKLAIDDFQFNVNDFAPYIEPGFSLLFSLLKEVSECDTKMRVLYVLSFMIERVGSGMKPFIGSLNEYLPELWQQSENHNMLRCAIVSTLVYLVKVLSSDSASLQPLIVGVVEYSCDLNHEGHVYLLEDGLDLWLALLENTQTPTSEIVNLLKNMPAILESSLENLRMSLCIIQAHVLLSSEQFFYVHGPIIIETLKSVFSDLRSEAIIMVTRFVELCLRIPSQSGIKCIQPLLLNIFENVCRGDECPMVLTMYLSIISRIILQSREDFNQVIEEMKKRNYQDSSEDIIITKIIKKYVDHMPLVTQQKKRKLMSLALCTILEDNYASTVLQFFPQIILNIVETLNDISRVNDMGYVIDSLIIDQNSLLQFEETDCETEHTQRKKKIALNDPVHYILLDDFLQKQLNAFKIRVGYEVYQQMLQGVNIEVKQQLQEYITL